MGERRVVDQASARNGWTDAATRRENAARLQFGVTAAASALCPLESPTAVKTPIAAAMPATERRVRRPTSSSSALAALAALPRSRRRLWGQSLAASARAD